MDVIVGDTGRCKQTVCSASHDTTGLTSRDQKDQKKSREFIWWILNATELRFVFACYLFACFFFLSNMHSYLGWPMNDVGVSSASQWGKINQLVMAVLKNDHRGAASTIQRKEARKLCH